MPEQKPPKAVSEFVDLGPPALICAQIFSCSAAAECENVWLKLGEFWPSSSFWSFENKTQPVFIHFDALFLVSDKEGSMATTVAVSPSEYLQPSSAPTQVSNSRC